MNVCHGMKCYLHHLAEDRMQTQNVDIKVFLITKYNIDSVLSL